MNHYYKVIRRFQENKHNGHIYEINDIYPKEGKEATKMRIKELSTNKNKYKKIYIKEVNAPIKKG